MADRKTILVSGGRKMMVLSPKRHLVRGLACSAPRQISPRQSLAQSQTPYNTEMSFSLES